MIKSTLEYLYTSWIPILIFLSGIGSGIYHGIYNKEIYHANEQVTPKKHEKTHTFWIHIVSGLVGSMCLYLLYVKYFSGNSTFIIGTAEVVVFFIGILGIVGLLPMTLWFGVLSIGKITYILKKYLES